MAKHSEAYLRCAAFLAQYKSRLTAPLETLALEMSERLEPLIKSASDEEAITLAMEDDLAARPHYLKDEPIKIPDDAADAACTDLKQRGELVERYGVEAVTAALKDRGLTGLGDKPQEPRRKGEQQKKPEAKSAEPESTSNPYSPNWKAPRIPRSPEDRERQRREAIAHLFKTFGARRSADMAKKFGRAIDGSPLRKVGAR